MRRYEVSLKAREGQTFTHAAFNDSGDLLYAWAYGQQSDHLYVWQVREDGVNEKADAEGRYNSVRTTPINARTVETSDLFSD
jgi:hypothetical protein